jgi:conjugative relaxase-like TrwC/TraI family protein
MLSFKFVTSAAGAASYFENTDDYYGAEGHHGEWVGAGAADLGLGEAPSVEHDTFRNLLDGQLPNGLRVRGSDAKAGRDRKGIDFTFSAPKSVSIQALVKGDKRLLGAHDSAVKKSLALLEQLVAARRKAGGFSYRERTGKMVAAIFRHELSRAQDPHLHTHAVVMNLTRRSDGGWRALSNEDMLKSVKLIGAFYRATLAAELTRLGFALRETPRGGWEMAHVSDAAIAHFSRRSREIEILLAARGQQRDSATTAQKQMLTLASRPRKTQEDRAWLRAQWIESARQAGIDLDAQADVTQGLARSLDRLGRKIVEAVRGTGPQDTAATQAVDFAVAHLAERQGIFTRSELLEVAYGRAATRASTAAVEAALQRARQQGQLLTELPLYQTARSLNIGAAELARDPHAARFRDRDELERLTHTSWVTLAMQKRRQTRAQAEASVDAAIQRGALVAVEPRFATPEARRAELRILSLERAGRGKVSAVLRASALEPLLRASGLNQGQREAVAMVLTTRDRFVGIQGLAGTGKSHMLSRAVAAIKAEAIRLSLREGFGVIGLAPYASQNRALTALGMQSQTLASFLARKAQQEALNTRSIVFLDEAGVVPAHQLEKLMSVVERQGARLILTGDRSQTHAVEAGKPFEQLQDAGMTKSMLTEIRRQTNETIRAAVVHAARKEVPTAVRVLQSHIVEVRSTPARHARIAHAYLALSEAERSATLIIAGTNEARRAINALVRQGLALPRGTPVSILDNVDMTRAELRSAAEFVVGQVVVPQRSQGSQLREGRQYRVLDTDAIRNVLTVRSEEGARLSFDPSGAPPLRVYQLEQIELAPGDFVRVSANDRALSLSNGDRMRVAAVSDTHLVLQDQNRRVSMARHRPLHLQLGYVSTIHSAQGLTRDRALVDANTQSLTANRAVFYVAISRPRQDITLFTDDAQKLATTMSREPRKFAALELRDAQNESTVLQARVGATARSRLAQALRPEPGVTTPGRQLEKRH